MPFATTGIHGPSPLNVRWLQLGIRHQRILLAGPPQTGAHERMHRTLEAATTRPPERRLDAQQGACDRLRVVYHEETAP